MVFRFLDYIYKNTTIFMSETVNVPVISPAGMSSTKEDDTVEGELAIAE